MTDLYSLFLKRRDLTPEKLNALNTPYNENLQNIDTLCDILKDIHDNHTNITIMPDFDCDGISSAIVGYSAMSQLGFNVNVYPSKPARGYGIHKDDIDDILKLFPKTKYIITCDVGITCYDAFEYAYQKGLKVLITDHHEEKANKPKKLNCEVIVNPTQLSETYTLSDICGAFVFYQVFMRYSQKYDQSNLNNISGLAIFAGIGTVSDVMRVIHQNKKLLIQTINLMRYLYKNVPYFGNSNPIYQNAFLGLRDFLLYLHDEGKLRNVNSIDEKFIGWTLVPIINSLKRMDLDMDVVYQIFFSSNHQERLQAIQTLYEANEIRKKTVQITFDDILKQDNPYAPFIYLTDAPGGIVGLLANKIMSLTGVPTFVINRQTLSGSGRSVPSFPVIDAVKNTDFNVNGHQLAFGISFTDEKQLKDFYEFLQDHIELTETDESEPLGDIILSDINENETDGKINNVDLYNFYNAIQYLRPFGSGFDEPEISVKLHHPQIMVLKDKHLKVSANNVDLLSWNSISQLDDLRNNDEITFTGTVSVNTFNGKTQTQLIGKFA